MKTIKAHTSLGVVDCKTIGKPFVCKGLTFQVVHFPYNYLNSNDVSYKKQVVEYSTGVPALPEPLNAKTVKEFKQEVNRVLTWLESRGANLQEEIDNHEKLNDDKKESKTSGKKAD